MKKIIALLVLVLAASVAKADPLPVFYTCYEHDDDDITVLHFCNQLFFALARNKARYHFDSDGYWLRVSSQRPPGLDGVTVVKVSFTHNISSQQVESFLDSTSFTVVNHGDVDNASQAVEDVLIRLNKLAARRREE